MIDYSEIKANIILLKCRLASYNLINMAKAIDVIAAHFDIIVNKLLTTDYHKISTNEIQSVTSNVIHRNLKH